MDGVERTGAEKGASEYRDRAVALWRLLKVVRESISVGWVWIACCAFLEAPEVGSVTDVDDDGCLLTQKVVSEAPCIGLSPKL